MQKRINTYNIIAETAFSHEGDYDYIKKQITFCKETNQKYSLIDGIKIYYNCGGWSHIRNSNTEPIIRLIVEANNLERAVEIKKELISSINNYLK